ncbi:MAG: hypothetical protein ACOY9Y_06000 [Bacillota bacterium]
MAAVAGHYLEAHRAGVAKARQIAEVKAPGAADLVVVAPGGFPKDANLYQAQKALYHAGAVVKPGGRIILVAEGSEGSGDRLFEETMAAWPTPEEVVKDFESREFQLGVHKAYLWARTLTKARTILVSSHLPEGLAKIMMVEQVGTLQAALDRVTPHLPEDAQVILMPKASSTIPVL